MSALAISTAKPGLIEQFGRGLRSAALALILATLAGGIAARPALADDDGWYRGHERQSWRTEEWRERAWREQEWRRQHPYVYTAPGNYYAYEPPPVPPSINFVFPLGHR